MKRIVILSTTALVLLALAILVFFIPASYVRVGFGGGTLPEKIKVSEMNRLERGPLTVYFYNEHKSLAEEAIGVAEQVWQILQKQMNLELGSFRVVLVAPRGERANLWSGALIEMTLFETILIWLGWQAPIFPFWIPYRVEGLQELKASELFFIYWAMPHEAMEHLIAKKVYHDHAARWIGDGLAEYVSYTISGELANQVQSWVLTARQKEIRSLLALEENRKSYNLAQEFLYGAELEESVEQAGYGASLAFWLQIAQQHSESTIKTFWERVSQISRPSAQEAARILSELTGEDIWGKLQNMNLQEVLRTLAGAKP